MLGVIAGAKAEALADKLYDLCIAQSDSLDKMLKLRQILEQLYKLATENSNRSFSNLFARMQFANTTSGISKELNARSNDLRILCNQISHDEIDNPSPEVFGSSALTVYNLITHYSPQFSHPAIEEYLKGFSHRSITPKRDSEKLSFDAVIDSWQVNDDSLALVVTRDDGTQCNVLLRNDCKQQNHDGRHYTLLSKSLWRYALIFFHNLSAVNGRENFFQSNPLTMVVLEPDFLVDATSIAECFENNGSNPAFFILNKLSSEASTEPILQGSVVNGIFDELVFNPQMPFKDLFRHCLAAQPIAFIGQGIQSAKNIYSKVQSDHMPQLTSFLNTIQDEDVLLEPSFICPEYGLQGRIDMLVNKDGKHSVIELKSGKAPAFDVWQAHRMQTVAYNMIIRSVYGAENISFASILYSQSKDNPQRNIANIPIQEQDLLMCRNRIIGIMHQLSENPDPIISWLCKANFMPESQHMQGRLLRFKGIIESLKPHEYEWFIAQLMRIIREIWFVKTGDNASRSESSYGHNALWQQSVADKKAAYKIVTGLIPQTYDKRLINFSFGNPEDIADFRQGDIVVLYLEKLDITKQEVLRGVITALDDKQLQISIRGGLLNNQRLKSQETWAIEHDNLETSLYTPLSSLLSFLSATPNNRELLLGIRQPKASFSHNGIADDFPSILERMKQSEELYIVQGPPGTGKTSGLLGTYINDLFHNTAKKAIILSFTNRAVDEICLCLIKHSIPFYRMGSSSVIQEQRLDNVIAGKRFEEMQQLIESNRIWVSTVQSANAWFNDMQRIIRVDELIIDEASQIIENSILGIMVKAPKTIMIGDQNQLPPICVQSNSPYCFKEPELTGLHYGSYNQSLMERLYKILRNTPHVAMLKKHFRMHNSIASLISHYYDDKLECATPAQQAELSLLPTAPKVFSHRLLWIDTPPTKLSHVDTEQIELVTSIITAMQRYNILPDNPGKLGIVTPFRAMIHALRKALGEKHSEISIDTVERFQGSERDIIILCLPLGNEYDLGLVESLSDDEGIDRKLNVSVSRAKQRLIILGSMDICRKSPHYRHLLDRIALVGAICDIQQFKQELECN